MPRAPKRGPKTTPAAQYLFPWIIAGAVYLLLLGPVARLVGPRLSGTAETIAIVGLGIGALIVPPLIAWLYVRWGRR